MARGRSRSRSRSRSISPSRRRRSPSDFRSMTRSRSGSRSPSQSRSRDRGRPLRSKYARSSSSSSRDSSPRSKKSQSVGRRPPSRTNAVPTIDLTNRNPIKDLAASWLDPKTTPPPAPDLNNPPPGLYNQMAPALAQAPPIDANPIQSVSQSQMRFPPPSHSSQNYDNSYQGDYSSYGTSFYSGGNPSYPDGHSMNNFSAPPGPSYPGQQMSGGGWNDYSSSLSGSGISQPGFANPVQAGMGGNPAPPAAIVEVLLPVAEVPNKSDPVEEELTQQKKKLAVEREEYFRRRIIHTKELKAVREKVVLMTEQGKADRGFMKDSTKVQEELLQKLKSIDSVIDMLTHIIGDRDQIADILKDFASALELPKKIETKVDKPEKRRRSKSRSRTRSPVRKKSSKKKSATPEAKVNIVHYDPELHWCNTCNVFPRSAIEYLTHLHSDVHKMAVCGKKSKDKPDEEFKPWRVNEPREPSPPSYKNAPSKRVPIRGVPFLVPATAWYCSMCRTWLGDMELAERHLKGPKHASTYTAFVSQNPHWEVDWLRDRTRAYEKNSEARAKVEEISKKLAGKGKAESKDNVDIGKLTEMLVSARNLSKEKAKKQNQSSSSSSSSSSSESEGEEEKKKAKKKKGKVKKKGGDKKGGGSGEENVKKRKKVRRSREKSADKKGGADRDEDRRDKPNKSDDKRRPERDRGAYWGSSDRGDWSNRGNYRGRGSFRGRSDRGRANIERRSYDDRSRGKEERASSDREVPGKGDKEKDRHDGREPDNKSPYRSKEHDWDRVMPASVRGGQKGRVMIGKRPGLGGGISREKFGFQRKNVFERLDKDKPDDLYGPLEPPKKED